MYTSKTQSKGFQPSPFQLIAAIRLIFIVAAIMPGASASQKKSPEEILAAAAENGKRMLAALKSYSYHSELTIQTVSLGNVITGEYYRSAQVYYDSKGRRQERPFENRSSLSKDIFISTSVINNMTGIYGFVITPETFKDYEFNYIGRERVDELNTYVFDVTPAIKLPDPEKSRDRYLKGRVWIDDLDLQVVKVAGEAVPSLKASRTARFESYFQNYGAYWFPAFTSAQDLLRAERDTTQVTVTLRMTSYKMTTR